MSARPAIVAILVATLGGCPPTSKGTPASPRPGGASAEGRLSYLEPSGRNLYLELTTTAGQTVGVELLPAVAEQLRSTLKKGMALRVSGRRLPGDRSVAYVIEVADAAAVSRPAGPRRTSTASHARLVPLSLVAERALPRYRVTTIAAVGLWPPQPAGQIRRRVEQAQRARAGTLIIDSGLTELDAAYRKPEPYLQIIARAAKHAEALGQPTGFYLPAFELRRAGGLRRKGPRLVALRHDWAQRTLAGKPLYKTRFGEQEFWNKEGDEVLWLCPSSPWRERFFARAVEAVSRGAQTLFVDVPYFQRDAAGELTCRCRHCQARFLRQTGMRIPRRETDDQRAYRRWLAWRHQQIARFLADLRRRLRRAARDVRLVLEEYPSHLAGATTTTGLEPALIGPRTVDAVAHEYTPRQHEDRPLSAADRLRLAATCAIYRGLDHRRASWVLSYAHRAADSRAQAALVLHCDASFWETRAPEMNDTSVDPRWRKQLFGWFARHATAFGRARSLANVVLLYSPESRDHSPRHFNALLAAAVDLVGAGVPFRVVPTNQLDRLRTGDRVVLAEISALAASQAVALRRDDIKLLRIGATPRLGPLGLTATSHRLDATPIPARHLARQLDRLPLLVRARGAVAVQLLQRRGAEIQIRLATLGGAAAPVELQLSSSGVGRNLRAESLALLGEPKPLAITRDGDRLRLELTAGQLTLVRIFESGGAS